MSALFLHCRPGFEAECAAEIQARAGELGVPGYCKAKPDSAYVMFQPTDPEAAPALHARLPVADLVFARQAFVVLEECFALPVNDRVTPLTAALAALPAPAVELFIETPDTNAAKQLTALARALERPLQEALRAAGRLRRSPPAPPAPELRVHVCLLSTAAAYVGYALRAASSPWPLGIPRLKFPREAPSRSTLKLEEALLHFLTPEERAARLRAGLNAVDLGAAPGGWTYQLLRRGLHVTAVDNGPMDPRLLDSGLLEHRREDGFRYRPAAPVDWMVCDIVESPMRVAELAARWLAEGWCRESVFNLKLPMKRRFQELARCLNHIEGRLAQAGLRHRLGCKQLYHDREEVTCHLRAL